MPLHKLFYPDSVAVVGASPQVKGDRLPFFQAFLKSGYAGKLFPVNPRYSEVAGHKTFPRLLEIPDPIDLAIITVRAPQVPPIISDCARKGVKFAVIFSSGFTEGGRADLEEKIKALARLGPTRLVGPNCLGPYCPGSGLTFDLEEKIKEPGNVAFVSQSGGHTGTYRTLAPSRGFHFNKVLSLGNQCDLSIQEVLRYYAGDPQIKVISAYVEQARGGREFSQALREVARQKPLIIWKGGSTEAGARAAFSHTGAMASFSSLWQKSVGQLGVIQVDDLEEMSDVTFACLSIPLPRGKRVAIVAAGGGSSVEMTDVCARAGLGIPILSDSIQRGIARLLPEANTSCKNPVDLGLVGFSPKVYSQAIRETARETGLDALMLYQPTEYYSRFNMGLDWVQVVSSELARIRREVSTPFVAVVPPLEQENLDMIAKRQSFIQKLRHSQIPVFPTIARAAKVLFRLQQYHRFLNQE